ncbi:MAG: SCO family protein [Phycisphaeraceae bacterium]
MNRNVALTALGLIALAALISLAAVLVILWLAWASSPQAPAPAENELPVLFEAPAFTLTNTEGEPVSDDAFEGRVWVANFIFTRCRSICPILTPRMAALQEDLAEMPGGESVRLVSVSVDPANDTPEVLAEYAEQHGADPERWTFLTEERSTLWPLIEDGFKLPVGEMASNPAMPILHSGKLVLVDARGRIRGYYEGVGPESEQDLRQLRRDIASLLEEAGQPAGA